MLKNIGVISCSSNPDRSCIVVAADIEACAVYPVVSGEVLNDDRIFREARSNIGNEPQGLNDDAL